MLHEAMEVFLAHLDQQTLAQAASRSRFTSKKIFPLVL
jgi:hypothetical protein